MEQPTHVKKMFEPPTCPSCGEEITCICEINEDYYIFNPKTGRFDDQQSGTITVQCPHCGENVLDDLFPDGVCNYGKPV